ncbi:hypothetical protein CDAR_305961 [Caerostris darwini]|uniref:Uncharacterized protein n=1 Tax=Caerostris darwini TaxID=1538125 RepID=A0AAV4VQW5_9ARAC|nr:hypothetical protein CDAR_305961 [Caerostris darwini]
MASQSLSTHYNPSFKVKDGSTLENAILFFNSTLRGDIFIGIGAGFCLGKMKFPHLCWGELSLVHSNRDQANARAVIDPFLPLGSQFSPCL